MPEKKQWTRWPMISAIQTVTVEDQKKIGVIL
jgi:hypothetical protein